MSGNQNFRWINFQLNFEERKIETPRLVAVVVAQALDTGSIRLAVKEYFSNDNGDLNRQSAQCRYFLPMGSTRCSRDHKFNGAGYS
jgi:hypothetical protein